MAKEYRSQTLAKYRDKNQDLLMSLPEFCKGYEISISGHNENNTITRYLEI